MNDIGFAKRFRASPQEGSDARSASASGGPYLNDTIIIKIGCATRERLMDATIQRLIR